MNNKQLGMLLVVAIVLLAGSFSVGLAGEAALPKADGKALYKYLTSTNPYQQWAFYPGTAQFYEGRHPHGALLTTYVNDLALDGIKAKSGTLADGAIIVKENYSPEKKLGAVTVMYRVDGYDTDAGDWFWAKYKADGSIEKEGKVAGCIGCHAAVISNDWLFTGPVK